MNKTYRTLLIALYLTLLALDCIFIFNQLDEYRIYTKPLLVPVLYIFLTLETVNTSHKKTKFYVVMALLFSFAGDFALLNSDDYYFFIGLTCFLIAHIWYCLFFTRLRPFTIKNITATVVTSLGIIIYLYFVINNIWQTVVAKNFEIPVVAYGAIIGAMLLCALNTGSGRRIKKIGFQQFVPGAILFVVSDSIIAVTKFNSIVDKVSFKPEPDVIMPIIVMLTYGLAQLLLIYGAVRIIRK